MTETLTRSKESDEGRRPLSFISYHQITTEILPQLRAALDANKVQKNSTEEKTEEEVDEIDQAISVLEAGIRGWDEILGKYENATERATNGHGTSIADVFKRKRPTCKRRFVTVSFCYFVSKRQSIHTEQCLGLHRRARIREQRNRQYQTGI